MPSTTLSTTLLESVNIVLANIGESPVNTITGAVPQQVSLALNTIEEVSADVQSKGWWFNQRQGNVYSPTANITIYPSRVANEWNGSIREEARRYITIRAARITQTRLIGSEELQKFSYNEELVSLAILQQAHVRNSNGVLSFNDFPGELRGLGIDEIMFLQGNIEEKIGTLRLGGELANITKTKAEAALIADQEALVTQQKLTEIQETSKRAAEKLLVDEQAGLITNQAATELKKALDLVADTTIKGKQGTLIDNQAATELKNALKVVAETSLLNDQEALVVNQAATELKKALDIAADTTLKGKQGSLIDNQAATELKRALDLVADTTLKGKQGSLVDAQALDVAADTTLKGKQGALIDAQELKTDAEKLLVDAQATDVAADTTLKGKQGTALDADTALKTSQKTQLDAQTAIEATAEKDFYDGVVAGTQATYRDFAAELRIMGIQESTFQSTPAYKKVELLKDAEKLRTATATETHSYSQELIEVNKVMRLIGEPPVAALNDNSLASECVRLLRDTDTDLQGRGWYFNTDADGVITQKSLTDVPQKYREYLNVRVAILLTELYPQSGIDIQRLPKMEQELRAYFKDRDFDDASYSIFDSYDAATRIGINRNYDLI